MPGTFISSKLARPRLPAGMVQRPRLTKLLGPGVTLVSAPAGYGKTVAVAAGLPDAAWVALDAGDNDPARLWTYAAAALGADAPNGSLETAIATLPAGTLVLEDVHVLNDERALAFAARVVPRLVLITRADPPIRVPRLRTEGVLREVRADTLAFTASEAAGLLGVEDAREITARTGGWPAALRLVALGGAPARLPRRRFVEYLVTQVLDGLERAQRELLARTAVLPRLSATLCDHVLERDDSAALLDALVRRNVFVTALDDGWYRVHDLIRERLAREDPALRRRAAEWFRARGRVEEAVEHFRAGGDHAAVAELIDASSLALSRSGRNATLLRWLRELPEDELAGRPGPIVAGLVAASATAQPREEIGRLLAAALRARAEHPRAWTRFHEASLQIVVSATGEDDVPAALAAADAAVALTSEPAGDGGLDPRELQLPALAVSAAARYLAGDHDAARRLAHAGLAHPEAPRRPHGYASVLATLALVEAEDAAQGRPASRRAAANGDAAAAREHADRALFVLRGSDNVGGRVHARAHAADAAVARLEGRLAYAAKAAERALAAHPHGAFRARVLLELASIRIERGELARAEKALDRARETLATCPDPGAVSADHVTAEFAAARAGGLPDALSPAELQVVALLPAALSTAQMATQLFLSPNTIKTHMKAIYRKLGVHSRDEALARATALGIVESPG